MRAALAFAIALVIAGPAAAADELASPARSDVPRTIGTGLAGVPTGASTVMGMSPGAAALLGVVIVGGIIAIAVDGDDDNAPAGTGSGGS